MNPALKILVTSQKGGVGKSTLSANLAAYLQSQNRKVTLIDFDTHGSSSAWLTRAPNIGVTVQHQILPLNQGCNRPLLDARLHLRRAAISSDIVICDLTWSDCMASELMFEYDLVIVPTSVSEIELAATSDFLHRHRWVFDSAIPTSPTLLLSPTRVQPEQMGGNSFSKQCFPVRFMLAPPILESQTAREMFQRGHLMNLNDACGASFNEYCRAVCELLDLCRSRHKAHTTLDDKPITLRHDARNNLHATLAMQSAILSRHRAEKVRANEPVKNINSKLSASATSNRFFSIKIPRFLRSHTYK